MSKDRYRHVAKFASETPWAIMPETLRVIQDVLAARLAGDHWSDAEIEARIEAAGGRRPARTQRQAPGAVAVVPLSGVIAPRANLLTQMSGGTSVEEFQQAFLAAMTDPDVGAVVLDVDSPGGSTDLLTEAAGRMRAVRGQKPVLAVADTLMASAAYWLGSQADEVAVTPSGLAGSIGVYATHMDVSGANEKLGVKPTLISAGRFKTEGNPHEPLTSEAEAHIQEIVDAAYDTFTLDVSKGRRAPVSDVRDGFGEGRVLTAKQAVKQGLADRVATLEETISRAAQLAQDGTAGRQVASVAFISGLDRAAGPIATHKTATTDGPWDGPANKARLRNDGTEDYYRSAYAWQDSEADATTKSAYKFIHHEVNADGDVGAANTNGCSAGIAVLNGGRSGTTIPSGDRQGVYDHLAKHIRDAGKEPPPLKGEAETDTEAGGRAADASFADQLDAVLCTAEELVDQGRELTASKRERLGTLRERLDALLALEDDPPAEPAAYTLDEEIARTLAMTSPRQ